MLDRGRQAEASRLAQGGVWRRLAITTLVILFIPTCLAQQDRHPVILIYCPGSPQYGRELATIIEQDGRFDADVRVCDSLDGFNAAMFYPDVKVAVVTLYSDTGQNLQDTLQWFFSQGGGLVGLGFAGARSCSGNASETVFPLFATAYRTSSYRPETKSFVMSLRKEEDDEISRGVSSFDVACHKIILSYNSSANRYEPRSPDSGELKVLFREATTGAPAVVRYVEEGVSVTFATFGGDDFERAPDHYRNFIDKPEFRTLFINALSWTWNNERKFDAAMEKASKYYAEEAQRLEETRDNAMTRDRRAELLGLARIVLTVVLAAAGCLSVYWLSFRKGSHSGG